MITKEKALKCDFHIHTVFSQCYNKKNITIQQNIDGIINTCYNKDINLIAICDHNSVRAYYEYLKIKNELESNIRFAKEYGFEEDKYKDKLILLQKYNYVNVLPGVEFDLKPGVHLLVVFNPNYLESEITSLINENGYNITDGVADGEPNFEIIDFLDKIKSYDCIVIAPHIDSKKGIYETISDGNYRGRIFKSDTLRAVTCNNNTILQKIKDLIINDKNYKRSVPLAFINASDAHSTEEIGKSVSFIHCENNFDDIKKAFEAPENYIGNTPNEDFPKKVKKIIESRNYTLINSKEDFAKNFDKHFIAHFNNGYGHILIGVIKDGSLLGISGNQNEIINTIESVEDRISTTKGFLDKARFYYESIGEGKTVALCSVFNYYKSIAFKSVEGKEESYIIKNSEVVEAKITDIVNLSTRNIISSFSNQRQSGYELLLNFIQDFTSVVQYSSNIIIKNKVEKDFLQLRDLCNIEKCVSSEIPVKQDYINGESDGNLIIIKDCKIRLEDTMLRCFAPQTTIEENLIANFPTIEKEKIILMKSCGTFLLDAKEIGKKITFVPGCYCLEIKDKYKKDISLYTLLFWFKSTCLLWYLCHKSDKEVDNAEFFLNNVIVPKKLFHLNSKIESVVKEIIVKERTLLSLDMPVKDFSESIIKHNNDMNNLANELDKIIYQSLNIEDTQIVEIEKILRNKKYCSYQNTKANKSGTSLDNIY